MNMIWHNQYRKEVEMMEQSPEALVSGWNEALRSILTALEADMRQTLKTEERVEHRRMMLPAGPTRQR